MTTILGYTSRQACAGGGVTYRQLDYWTRTGLAHPSVDIGAGSGRRRRWSYRDIVRLAVIAELIASGMSHEQIRVLMGGLTLPMDLADSTIFVANGARGVTSTDAIPQLLRSMRGVLTLIPLTTVQQQVDLRLGAPDDHFRP